jgi:hypothetical protein
MGHSPTMGSIGVGATSGKGGPFDLGPSAIYAAIDNPDALHERAVAACAEIVMGLTDQEDGSREFAARDLEGNVWCFGTYRPRRLNRRWHHAGCNRGRPNSSDQRVSRPQAALRERLTASLRRRVPHRLSAAAQGQIDGSSRWSGE